MSAGLTLPPRPGPIAAPGKACGTPVVPLNPRAVPQLIADGRAASTSPTPASCQTLSATPGGSTRPAAAAPAPVLQAWVDQALAT